MSETGEARNRNASLRRHLLELLEGKSAHVDAERVLDGIPPEHRGIRPEGMPHSLWELLEHLRIAQRDILDFSTREDHPQLDWPGDYWPDSPEPPSDEAWEESVAAFHRDLAEMKRLVEDPASDLFTPFPWGDGQTLLREAMLVADHHVYHLGQMVLVRRVLGCW